MKRCVSVFPLKKICPRIFAISQTLLTLIFKYVWILDMYNFFGFPSGFFI